MKVWIEVKVNWKKILRSLEIFEDYLEFQEKAQTNNFLEVLENLV